MGTFSVAPAEVLGLLETSFPKGTSRDVQILVRGPKAMRAREQSPDIGFSGLRQAAGSDLLVEVRVGVQGPLPDLGALVDAVKSQTAPARWVVYGVSYAPHEGSSWEHPEAFERATVWRSWTGAPSHTQDFVLGPP